MLAIKHKFTILFFGRLYKYKGLDNLILAEKILNNVAKYDSCNFQALITLIKIQIKLSRSKRTIKRNIQIAYSKTPYNQSIQRLYKQFCGEITKNKHLKNK